MHLSHLPQPSCQYLSILSKLNLETLLERLQEDRVDEDVVHNWQPCSAATILCKIVNYTSSTNLLSVNLGGEG